MSVPPLSSATAFAAAKLNLYLHVLGRRQDGYHLLDSLIGFAAVGDQVTVTQANQFSLRIEGPFAGPLQAEDPNRNLVARAVFALAEAVGRSAEVAVVLDKHLPVASGIGGGSADAAAALRALATLWGLAVDDPRPAAIAPRLGADVPVCLSSRTAYFGGIGDQLDPALPLPPVYLVLVNPGVAVATAAVFSGREGPWSVADRLTDVPTDCADLARMLTQRRNDLAAPAIRAAPVIAETLAALQATPDCLLARMSGSGATCFGLYPTRTAAQSAAAALNTAHPGWWVAATHLLG